MIVRGARLPEGHQVHLLAAYDTATGIVLAQQAISAKSSEIPAFTPLHTALEKATAAFANLAHAIRAALCAEAGDNSEAERHLQAAALPSKLYDDDDIDRANLAQLLGAWAEQESDPGTNRVGRTMPGQAASTSTETRRGELQVFEYCLVRV